MEIIILIVVIAILGNVGLWVAEFSFELIKYLFGKEDK